MVEVDVQVDVDDKIDSVFEIHNDVGINNGVGMDSDVENWNHIFVVVVESVNLNAIDFHEIQ
jgi:hypothetical protein